MVIYMVKNGKNKLVKKGKSKYMVIFSIFVICMTITLSSSFAYKNSYTTYYKNYYKNNTKEEEFINRVSKVYKGYLNNGSSINLKLFLATIVVSQNLSNISYSEISEDDIHIIFKCMNTNVNVENYSIINYNKDAFRKNIIDEWLTKGHLKKFTVGYSDKALDNIVDDIYNQSAVHDELFGEEDISSNIRIGGVCSYKIGDNNYSNIKVNLLNCEGDTSVAGEELLDFETYITGVVYQENGNSSYEALKAQAVAARSYALRRPKAMGGAFGIKLQNENGQTTLSLRSCTNDQVFCHPDKGCWSNVRGGQTSSSIPAANCTVHSGYDTSKTWTRNKLDEDSNVRKAVKETHGEVAVDSNGNVVYTTYTNTNQSRWNTWAKEGKDYFEILKKDYSNVATIKSDCTAGVDTELAKQALTWKQYDSRWGSQYIGTKTIKQVGCMVTATAIQIARSGTEIKGTSFDPGVFVSTVKANHGFSGNNFNVDSSSWSSIAPNFKVGGMEEFSINDSMSKKTTRVSELISQGYYVIARIYHPGQHWVAITDVQNGKIMMADPGSESTDFCGKYTCNGRTFTRIYYFKSN